MKTKAFLNQLNHEKIVAAIHDAEQKTSGEIRVYISHRKRQNITEAAAIRFKKLGMEKTAQRNAVLIYLVPRTRKFAILGDAGIHEKCGENFWQENVELMTGYLKNGDPLTAITAAIEKIGSSLATHFPYKPDDRNELPNSVEEGD